MAYVPPHLRSRAPPSSPSPIPGPSSSATYSESRSAPAGRSQSRTPWSATPSSASSSRDQSPQHNQPSRSAPARGAGAGASPVLHVFGDSFTGPLKLLSDSCASIKTFKGASAKGLNNPNSIKQVSKDLLPAMNNLLAPPPYVYVPSAGRWVLLVFGNVDLQINYLYQLQHKPISPLSFPSDAAATPADRPPASPATADGDADVDEPTSDVLATATETSLRGPALGPELFVRAVASAYTSWLERNIVNGPIGDRLRPASTSSASVRKRPPGKVLIAAALPPLVEDEVLHRIPEKYVERLEEDHAKAQKRMERRGSGSDQASRTPWARRGSGAGLSPSQKPVAVAGDDPLENGISTIRLTDDAGPPGSPQSGASTASTSASSTFHTQQAMSSSTTSTSPPPPTAPHAKTSIESLLQHDPPLCTLAVRIAMTAHFNRLVSAFCNLHHDVLSFVDISPAMLPNKATGAVDRAQWACPVDPTNIHPLWESTLPLWLQELAKVGVPTGGFRVGESAEETMRAYEVDKRRRVEEGGRGMIKLRDE